MGKRTAKDMIKLQERLEKEEVHLRWLEKGECLEAEPLWREVFWEDTELFTDYYFRSKASKNRGLVLEGDDGICSMLYLTPERMKAGEDTIESAYIVGVATKENYRHRGYMAALLAAAYDRLYEEKMPFVFLMPASPAIYEPFGFTYIYDRPVWELTQTGKGLLKVLGPRDTDRMADFAERFLKREKRVYVLHDSAYYKQQIEEIAAQSGRIYGYEENGGLKALCMYTEEEGCPEVLELLADDETLRRFAVCAPQKKPVIMARIIHAEAMLSLLRSDIPVVVRLAVSDPLIDANNGIFDCRIGPDAAEVTRDLQNAAADAAFDITDLAAVLFGYTPHKPPVFSKVRLLAPVWINEII